MPSENPLQHLLLLLGDRQGWAFLSVTVGLLATVSVTVCGLWVPISSLFTSTNAGKHVISPTLLISKLMQLRGDRAAARSVLPWDSLGVCSRSTSASGGQPGGLRVEQIWGSQNTADNSAVSLQRFTETQPGALRPEELQSCGGPRSPSCTKATKCLDGENDW